MGFGSHRCTRTIIRRSTPEPEVAEAVPPVERVMNDFRFSKWPDGMDDRDSDDVARYCDSLNDGAAWETFLRSIERGDRVVSFSHFLPRLELFAGETHAFLSETRASERFGSSAQTRGRNQGTHVNDGDMTHVFGHTHFGWNTQIDGVRYVQASLATPKEWQKRPRSLIIGNWTNAQPETSVRVHESAFAGGRRRREGDVERVLREES